MGPDESSLKWSAEEIFAKGDRSGRFSDIEMVELTAEPRLIDFHLEALTGNEYLVMLREDLGEARVLFEEYVFEDVPAHRIIEFVDLLERGEVDLSFTRFKKQLILRVSVPEGTWVDGRRFRDDLSDWEKSVVERN
ncbi:hypothetical protein [Streptomyces sp. NRRL S-495]|uniref:hypothetical protein n=1 Tax=Streptomyces sp. NRRL S-495 TaxID=1609133 RepID=UPI000AAD58E4|nr:hypothetical protein [Streptomyces sp. NRRL S-495]